MGSKKKFVLVLHSHIPYVLAHGSWPHGMDWLFEAAAESYLPLYDVLDRLGREGITPNVSISFTPVLAAQLKDSRFKTGFWAYLGMKAETAARDRTYFGRIGNRELEALASDWSAWYLSLAERFREVLHEDIVEGFRSLQDQGWIEVLTSAATHGYFPLLAKDESIRHQIRQGRQTYRSFFGREPRGFWLPECGYRPAYAWKSPFDGKPAYPRQGIDQILGEEGIGYFFVDGHLLEGGEATGVYIDRFPALKRLWDKSRRDVRPLDEPAHDPYATYAAYPSNTPFLVRDEISSSRVWSRSMGYPGDGAYLEFHKKHFPGGLRYWRITSSDPDLGAKAPYVPAASRERLREHALHFVSSVEATLNGREEGTVVALYDTELFGHWWFEGPEWLYLVLKGLAKATVTASTGSAALEAVPPRTTVSLPEGSWGQGGFHWVWLNEETSWIWKKIYRIEDLAAGLGSGDRLNPRLWKQFIREKFLLESSDWPFLISTLSARDYAENRAAGHFERAEALAGWLKPGRPLNPDEEAFLGVCETEDDLFEEVVSPDGQVL